MTTRVSRISDFWEVSERTLLVAQLGQLGFIARVGVEDLGLFAAMDNGGESANGHLCDECLSIHTE
jgi:hypothetical protein